MRKLVTALSVLVALGVGAVPASARTAAVIVLPQHGTVILAHSHVRCGAGTVNKQKYVDCGIAGIGSVPKTGGYVVVMTADGNVTVLDSSTQRQVFSRATASAYVGGIAHAGDKIVLPGVPISCKAASVSGKPAIFCYHIDAKGKVKPSSVSFGVSDAIAIALGWNKVRKVHVLGTWLENG
jgi:hypothetical protein